MTTLHRALARFKTTYTPSSAGESKTAAAEAGNKQWSRLCPLHSVEDFRMKMKLALPTVLVAILIAALLSVPSVHSQTAPHQIDVTAKKFNFAPAEITVKKGQPVVIVLKSVDVAHGLRFRDLGVNVKVDKGKTGELAFTPTKTGDFVGACSVFCGSGHGRMKLTLHVVD
jgi:cytochrome c oxidase subunit II